MKFMKTRKITYNPQLSIRENAMINNVSEASIRLYIKSNNIDRRSDEKIKKSKTIQALKNKYPNITIREMQQQLGLSYNTIAKYLSINNELFLPLPKKISAFDLSKADNIIKSVSDSTDKILLSIMSLYNNSQPIECDLTYSKGVFWKKIQSPKFKFDKSPIDKNVRPLSETEKLPDNSFSSIIFDLPFLVKDEKSAKSSLISQRFDSFRSVDELYNVNSEMLALSYRLLTDKGLLVIKTMDIYHNGRQYWISDFVHSKAIETGFVLIDKFILVSQSKLLSPSGRVQHCARKWHSYFFVLRKIATDGM